VTNKLSFQFLSNAGILIRYGTTKILIDGIYRGDNEWWSHIPESTWKDMLCGIGDYSNADYLLFTHRHYDHFSRSLVNDYLAHNKVKAYIPPAETSSERCIRLEDDIFLREIPTIHMGEEYRDVQNNCLYLRFGSDFSVLFTGDAEPSEENFKVLDGLDLDAAVVNPLFFHWQKGRNILRSLNTKHVIINHIPFPETNPFYIKLVDRDIPKFGYQFSAVTPLKTSGQTITF